MRHSNLFNGQTLPVGNSGEPIRSMRLPEGQQWFEINTVADYLNLVEAMA
ncbi:MAG: hypothetical protein IJT59_00460 [Desulfovibrionaceae bacterium]|nr:hypothetical protein [Desulfovibrionaceae bacterium]